MNKKNEKIVYFFQCKQNVVHEITSNFILKNHKRIKAMSSNESLSEMLKDDNLTARRLFSAKNIVTDIKNNIQTFVSYALRHKQFIFQCLQIALETPFADLQKQNNQNIAFNICEIICCDEPVIADLFFQPTLDQQRKNSQISQNIQTQEPQTIQTEAQRLFCDDEEDTLKKLQTSPIQIKKNQIAKKSLSILKSLNNESSLGYLYKIWSFLIRNNSNQVIEFFDTNREYFQLLINNLWSPSVSNLVAQIIVCEDRNKEYKYEKFKKEIIQRIIEILIEKKQDSELYEGICILLEEVFNSSKQSYCENFDDFKRQVNYFFSSFVIQRLFNILVENNEKSFENVLKYFELLLTRMNSQKQDAENWRQEHNQPFVKFQTQILITNFPKLISLLRDIQGFNTVVKISFVNFLFQVVETTQFSDLKSQLNFIEIFENLMRIFSTQKSKGLYKMKLSKLIEKIINYCTKEELEAFVEKNEDFFTRFYPSIQSINMENSRIYNKNEMIGFECQILFQIENKVPGVVDASSKVNQKNLKRMQKKYETKIANYGRPNESINLQEVGSFTFNEIPALRLPEGFKINNFNTERKGLQSSRNTESREETKAQQESRKAQISQERAVEETSGEQKEEKKMKIELPKIPVREERKEEQQNKGMRANLQQGNEGKVTKSQQVNFYIRHGQLMQ